jgi:type II secretory pathway pseudopilin PulG
MTRAVVLAVLIAVGLCVMALCVLLSTVLSTVLAPGVLAPGVLGLGFQFRREGFEAQAQQQAQQQQQQQAQQQQQQQAQQQEQAQQQQPQQALLSFGGGVSTQTPNARNTPGSLFPLTVCGADASSATALTPNSASSVTGASATGASATGAAPMGLGEWRSLAVKMRCGVMNKAPAALIPLPDGGVRWVLQDARNGYRVTCADEAIAFRFPPRALTRAGDSVAVSMTWTTMYPDDGRALPGDACPVASGVDETDTRCMFGTGDFRIGLLESRDGALDNANGVQFRVSPHMSRGISATTISIPFKWRPPCDDPWLVEALGRAPEAHSNCSLWARNKANSGQGIGHAMDDQCSRDRPARNDWLPARRRGVKHCGFGSLGQRVSQPGAGAPYNAPFEVSLELRIVSKDAARTEFAFTAVFNGARYVQTGAFAGGFAPSMVDTLCLTYPNTWRVYGTVELANVRVTP